MNVVRWSKKTDALVRAVAGGCRPRLQSELGHWLETSARFSMFVDAHRDKIRKKLGSNDEEARLDVRAELLVAQRLLLDRRFEVVLEAYGAQRLGPDLSLTFRTNQHFNLEVTRVRGTHAANATRIGSVIAGKLRQLPGEVPNALVITGIELGLSPEDLTEAARQLRAQLAGNVVAHYLRLGGVFALDEATEPIAVSFWTNREARRPLPGAAVAAITGCFAR